MACGILKGSTPHANVLFQVAGNNLRNRMLVCPLQGGGGPFSPPEVKWEGACPACCRSLAGELSGSCCCSSPLWRWRTGSSLSPRRATLQGDCAAPDWASAPLMGTPALMANRRKMEGRGRKGPLYLGVVRHFQLRKNLWLGFNLS